MSQLPVDPMMGNPIPRGSKDIFSDPMAGEPIKEDGHEYDFSDPTAGQPIKDPSNWERFKSRVSNPFEGLTQVPGALYDLAKAESEHPGAGQAALWKGAGSVAIDSVNPVPEFKRLYGEGKSIPASIVGSIPMGVGQTVTDLTEGKVPETIGDITNFAPALLGVKGIREAKVLNTPVGEVIVNAAKKAGSGTVRAVTSPTALGAGGLVAGLATGNPALGALTGLELAKWRLGQLAKKSGATSVVPEGGIAEVASVLKQMIKSERGVSGAKAEAIIAKMPDKELASKVEEIAPKLTRQDIKAQNMERIYKDRLSRGMDYAVPDDSKAKIGWKPQEPGTVESKLAPEPVPEAHKPPQETISAQEAPKEPAKAAESPKTPSVEAGDDLEGTLKASLDKKDVVYAPPAFPGQQGAKGATKARFEMVAERNKSPQKAVMSEIERASANVKKWVKSNTRPEKIKDQLNSIFKGKRSFSTEEVETLIKIAQENE